MTTQRRLTMSLGEAIFTQRAIRRFKPDPIPDEDLGHILESATRAPSGGNRQPWHFVVVRDANLRAQFAPLYHEAWWAKRRDEGIGGPKDIPAGLQPAMRLAEEIGQAPVLVLVCATSKSTGAIGSVIPAAQNLLLAARALGIGGTITTLHPQVEARVHQLFQYSRDSADRLLPPPGVPTRALRPDTA